MDHSFGVDSGINELSNGHLLVGSNFISIIIIDNSLLSRDYVLVVLLVVSFCKFRIDNSQCQIKQEEGSSEHQWNEEDPDHICKAFLHVSLNLTPAFEGHALEYGKKRVEDIVKIGDTIVWAFVGFSTMVTTWATFSSKILAAYEIVIMDNTCLDGDAPLLEHTTECLSTSDSEDQEEEE